MSETRAPVIGHVTPLTGVGEPVRIAEPQAWEALAGPPMPNRDPKPGNAPPSESEDRTCKTHDVADELERALSQERAYVQTLEARVTDLLEQRNAYRDNLRGMLGVELPDGEALIALAAAKIKDGHRVGLMSNRLYTLAHRLGANLPTPSERYAEDALLRVELGVTELQRDHASTVISRDRWMARARKAEAGKAGRTPRKRSQRRGRARSKGAR